MLPNAIDLPSTNQNNQWHAHGSHLCCFWKCLDDAPLFSDPIKPALHPLCSVTCVRWTVVIGPTQAGNLSEWEVGQMRTRANKTLARIFVWFPGCTHNNGKVKWNSVGWLLCRYAIWSQPLETADHYCFTNREEPNHTLWRADVPVLLFLMCFQKNTVGFCGSFETDPECSAITSKQWCQ